jgi:tetratricopeptide (TPR) repeat protein
MAEESERYQLTGRLRTLLNDVNGYALAREESQLYQQYHNGQLAYLEMRFDDAQAIFHAIGHNERAEPTLRAYSLCGAAMVYRQERFLLQPGGLDRVRQTVQRSLELMPEGDPKRVVNLMTLGKAYLRLRHLDEAIVYFERAHVQSEQMDDAYGMAQALKQMMDIYATSGDWRQMFHARQRGLQSLPAAARTSVTYARLLGEWGIAWSWAGRYAEAEQNLKTSLKTMKQIGEVKLTDPLRDLIYTLGVQGKYQEAQAFLLEGLELHRRLYQREDTAALSFWGYVLLRQGDFQQSESYLSQSRDLKQQLGDDFGLALPNCWLGLLYELRQAWAAAMQAYEQALGYRRVARRYFECGALTGLMRVKHAQGEPTAIAPLLAEAEQLAQQYEYNDHLASLRLTQGHLAWPSFQSTLNFYQHALIYALRYNRFLLDEVLSGRAQGSPLHSIIPHCMEHGAEGRNLLLTLREWWRRGNNDTGVPRPDTISPLPEGMALIEAERIARHREPGDGTAQRSVIEQIEAALK